MKKLLRPISQRDIGKRITEVMISRYLQMEKTISLLIKMDTMVVFGRKEGQSKTSQEKKLEWALMIKI